VNDSASFPESFGSMLSLLEGREPIGKRAFPPSVTKEEIRIAESETVHSWFVRCVERFMDDGKALRNWQIEEDLAIFALIEWDVPDRRISACSINAIKTPVGLEDYYLEPTEGAFYFRLDYDCGTLGPMFTHALPHLHAWPSDAAPRFAVEGVGENFVVDFLEWIYRHFYHDRWLAWVDSVCRPAFAEKYGEEAGPLDRIFRAFHESQIRVLREHKDDIERIKTLLRGKKDKNMFGLRASVEDHRIMAYP